MNPKNPIDKSFQILAFAILVFIVLGNFTKSNNFFGLKLKNVDLLSDLKKKTNDENNNTTFVLENVPQLQINIEDSIESANIASLPDSINKISRQETSAALKLFFDALAQTKKSGSKTRIAYFGDSMIEGDLLTQDLRNLLQKQFGGEGVGFVPVSSPVSGFRRTINNSCSENWQAYNLLNSDTILAHKPGISGHVFLPNLNANTVDSFTFQQKLPWVKYSASKAYASLKQFHDVKLYYGKTISEKENTLYYNFGQGAKSFALSGGKLVNQIELSNSFHKQYLTLNVACSNPLPIYGLSFDSDSGVFVDNFAFRGNSGLALTKIPIKLLREFNNYFDYKLIVLQYGLNVANAETKDYHWYEVGMIRVINYLKICFPNADFLIVSVGDKSYKHGNKFETDPSIPLLVETQKRIAEKTNAAFFNLYEAMGGYNSMVNWVEGDTVLANKDYTHLNFKGANKVAHMLYNELIKNRFAHYLEASNSSTPSTPVLLNATTAIKP